MPEKTFDVCIVGSGPGGGIASYVLSQAGLKVALVEGGGRFRAGVDYNAHVDAHALLEERLKKGLRNPIPGVWSDHFERNHFVGVGDRPGHGQLRALGGRSLCWAGHSLRFGPVDFQQWPISYQEVSPWYSKAERLMLVHGYKDGLYNLPDGEFQKGVPLRCGEVMLKRGVEVLKTRGRSMEFVAQRKAIPTQANAQRRTVCHYCGHCMQGCEVDSKYTSANTPIPLALKTGNLTLFLESTMTGILMDRAENRVRGIRYQDAEGRVQELKSKALVVSCSAVETARHLLLNDLANSSGQVGRNLTSHFGVSVIGLFPQIKGRDSSNDDGTDFFHGLLTGLYWDKPNPNFEGTYQVQCGSGVHPSRLPIRNVSGFGSELKKKISELNSCHALMNMQGSLLVSSKKFIDLDSEKRDRYGLALPRVHLHYEDSDVAMARDMVATSEDIIKAAGGGIWSTPGEVSTRDLVIDLNHWVGTCKMGTDPKTSVVNTSGRTHDIPNLWIGDASVFAAYPEKNPTLTNIALTWRTSEKLLEAFRQGEV